MITFKSLDIGQSFDFIDDNNPHMVSFWDRCVKISERKYKSLSSGHEYQVGSTSAKVYHPCIPMPIHGKGNPK